MDLAQNRWETRAWWASALLVLLFYLATVPRVWQCEGVDEIEYLALADSLARDFGYTLYGTPYVYYPPLFPALLAPLYNVQSPANWRLLYALNAACGWLALVLLAAYLRHRQPDAGRPAAWLALCAYYPWSFSTRYLMAEQVHFLGVAVALILADRLLAGRGGWRGAVPGLAIAALAAVTAKASGIALVGALGVAGIVHLLTRRKWGPVWALAVPALLAGLFVVGWEIRAAWLDPGAKESYGRWALKWLGLSKETAGVVAANFGEGLEGPTPWIVRLGLAMERLGQYVLSVPRPPPNFAALGVALSLVVLAGLVRELRRHPASVLAWYVGLSLVMLSATTWASSYLRYLYPLSPLLFWLMLEGVAGWSSAWAQDRLQRGLMWVMKGAGATLLAYTAWRGWQGGPGAEGMYRSGMGLLVAGLGAALVAGPCLVRRLHGLSWRRWLTPALAAVLAGQSALLALQRYRHTQSGAALAERQLDDVHAAANWIRSSLPADVTVVSSLPRLAAFLTGLPVRDQFEPAGSARQDVVWLLGDLPGNPAFRPHAEAALQIETRRRGWQPAFVSGGNAVLVRPAATGESAPPAGQVGGRDVE